MRKAVIDIGSNSMRCLVADIDSARRISYSQEALRYTRLLDGMDENERLSHEKIEEALMACRYFLRKAKKDGAKHILVTATSVFRRAVNQAEILDAFKTSCGGIIPRILSAEQEAYYAYHGAHLGLADRAAVLDIGAGSVEISWQDDDKIKSDSLPYGALWLVHHPEDKMALAKALERWRSWPLPEHLIGVGGSLTTMVMALDQENRFIAEQVDKRLVSLKAVTSLYQELSTLSSEEKRERPGVPLERVDSVVMGLYILQTVMEKLHHREVMIRTMDSLYGLLLSDLTGQWTE